MHGAPLLSMILCIIGPLVVLGVIRLWNPRKDDE